MLNKIKETAERYGMFSDGKIIAGVSGGADSVALLHALLSVKEEYSLDIAACHINHNLRGEESDSDQRFVEKLCESFGVKLFIFSVKPAEIREKHESLEEAARRARYDCFKELCGQENARLATAHTASDNGETVLINLIRGTGTKGLCGIPPVRDYLIRPLIRCTRDEIEEYCTKNGLSYVTDSTNLSDDYTRNKIRHRIIPALTEFNPSFTEGISRMTAAVLEDSDFLLEYSGKIAEEIRVEGKYPCQKLKELHPAILSRIISAELTAHKIEPSALRINQCREIIAKGGGKVNLCKNRFAAVRKKMFFILEEIQNYRSNSI